MDSALVSGIGSKLDTLAGNISQNADILVNLGTVLDKIQRLADVTVQAMDTLAKVSIRIYMLRIVKLSGYGTDSPICPSGLQHIELSVQGMP